MQVEDVYEQTPWRQFYPDYLASLDEEAAEFKQRMDRSKNLAEMITEASQEFSEKTAFTTCMPNGMFGSLSYQQVEA